MKYGLYPRFNSAPKNSFFLLGPRGSGKTTWLKAEFPQAHWISLLDEARFQEYLVRPGLFRQELRRVQPGSWVIVDEVQRLPHLLNEVHAAIEDQKLKFALCGSSARKLRRSGVNLLAGRAISRTMYPFVPEELGHDFELPRALRWGTLPIIWSSETPEETLLAYSRLYLKEEIQGEALVRNLPGFARFLEIAALFHSQTLDFSSLARDSGTARSTVQDYVQILEDTLLGYRLLPFETKLRVKQPRHAKWYWIDAGIPRAIKNQLGPPSAEEKGALLEGFVLMMLRAYRDQKALYDQDCYWASSHEGSIEVDFLVRSGKKWIGIEVKSSAILRPEFFKGLRALNEKLQLERKILVFLGERSLKTEDGIEVLSFLDWCTEVQKGLFF